MNTYDLSKVWFDFCFENPEKISPNHTAIYFFALDLANRLSWKEKFGFPSHMAMEAIGIKKYQTYIKYFNQIVEWGFFELVQKSKNQYSSNIISIKSAIPENGKALGKAIIKHAAKQTQKQVESNSPIVKQETKETNKQEKELFDIFRNSYKRFGGKVLGNDTEFENFIKKHKDWKEVLQNLSPLLECINNQRNALTAAKQFVPPWKNLKTWIFQRCWEEETSQSQPTQTLQEKIQGHKC